ncbi:amidohydrolase [Nocardioides sp. KC13]|uniref:Amidohydrolase n=1 Tax=Nocardioides turkmenicus TaxID=2711220 RepID=A0A6M1R8S7_9ACTN|nr:amidohydrolase [Nocardioides sp. KC13]NGN93978.1 amidohydrolase [Nocardioides sp. KC13]
MGGRPDPAELVLRGGRVLREGRWEDAALAVRDGRIAAIGASADALVGPRTVVEDLDGRWVLPAFHDSHVHPVQAGLEMNQCDLTGLSTLEEYLDAIGSYAAANPSPAWITGGGWSMDSFPGGVPSASPLDQLLPDRPVFLPNRDHHSAWVNSRALEIAGIDARTPDPADGRIERDASGRPTGALHEGAMALVGSLVPAPTSHDLMEALLTAQRHLHSVGIVGWQDALVGTGLGMPDSLPTYVAAHDSGALTAKVVLAQWWDRDRGLEQLPSLIERRSLAAQAGLDASSVKLMQDGVCETHTAAMLDPYRDAHGHLTDNRGLSFIPADALAAYVAALDAAGFQAHIHALGDRAVRDSLDAVAHARAANGPSGLRHHLAHVQVVDAADVPRFAELEVTANIQPLWACRDEAVEVLTLPFLAPAAREQQYVFGSLLRTGARIACGSDWPVSDPAPLLGMHVAVNRRSPDQPADAAPLLPDEALSVTEALAGYTTGTAFLNRLEDSTGRIETGYAADLVVVDHDILVQDTTVLGRTQVTHTYADGREVHRR